MTTKILTMAEHTRIPDLHNSGRKHQFPVQLNNQKSWKNKVLWKSSGTIKMDTAIDLSDASKALDLKNIREQLMCV